MIEIGIFVINIDAISAFFNGTSPIVLGFLAIIFITWIPISYLSLKWVLKKHVKGKQANYTKDWKWVVLAIDIPALNVQTPKAVEQMFSHLAGILVNPSLADRIFKGFIQEWFSFEIISIEGYIQFVVRTEEKYQDLLEAALYAQYPEAEVIEIEDYVHTIPGEYPNETHDMWGGDFTLQEDDAYPIRQYHDFEHSISKDTVLKDSMGTFLESFSRINVGEQMWFQMIVEPAGSKWKEDAILKIKEVIGEKVKAKDTAIDKVAAMPIKFLESVGDQVFGREDTSPAGGDKDNGPVNQLSFMTPGKKKIVEAMEDKIAKLGFHTKIRGLYIARKEVFRPSRGVNALIGAMNQYNIP
ncbi:MAG: hypothetical protein HOJ29_03000, partial [Candidatus Magasanikbacteria bacterium]|nr:hypothetical protein [Candidatus Magasanikbacteria bacterium]